MQRALSTPLPSLRPGRRRFGLRGNRLRVHGPGLLHLRRVDIRVQGAIPGDSLYRWSATAVAGVWIRELRHVDQEAGPGARGVYLLSSVVVYAALADGR